MKEIFVFQPSRRFPSIKNIIITKNVFPSLNSGIQRLINVQKHFEAFHKDNKMIKMRTVSEILPCSLEQKLVLYQIVKASIANCGGDKAINLINVSRARTALIPGKYEKKEF